MKTFWLLGVQIVNIRLWLTPRYHYQRRYKRIRYWKILSNCCSRQNKIKNNARLVDMVSLMSESKLWLSHVADVEPLPHYPNNYIQYGTSELVQYLLIWYQCRSWMDWIRSFSSRLTAVSCFFSVLLISLSISPIIFFQCLPMLQIR